MKRDEAKFARFDALDDGLDSRLRDVVVAKASPPNERVGRVELGVGQAGVSDRRAGPA